MVLANKIYNIDSGKVHMHAMRAKILLPKFPFPAATWNVVPWAHSISIGSAVFAGLMYDCDQQTHTQTVHATW